jgi:hypothetical protein
MIKTETDLAQQIVHDCLSSSDQALFTGKDFQNDFKKMQTFLKERIRSLGLQDLQSIFCVYLALLGIDIEGKETQKGVDYLVTKDHIPGMEIAEVALCLSSSEEWDKVSSLLTDARFNFVRLLIQDSTAKISPDVAGKRLILETFENIERVFLWLSLDEYREINNNIIRFAPDIRDAVLRTLEAEFEQFCPEGWSRRWHKILKAA